MCGCTETYQPRYNSVFQADADEARSLASRKGWNTRRARADVLGVVQFSNGGGYKSQIRTRKRK